MPKLANFCDKLIKICLCTLAFVLPLFYLPWTFEAVEFNKQNFLIVVTLIAALAWLGKIAASKTLYLKRSFFNLLALLYLGIYAISAIFSLDKFRSLVGASGGEKNGLITVFCFVLLYFVVINNLREIKIIKNIIYSFLASSGIIGIFSLLVFLGVIPSWMFPNMVGNPIGSLSALSIFFGASFVLASTLLFKTESMLELNKKILAPAIVGKILLVGLAFLDLFLMAAIDVRIVWASFVPAVAFILAFNVLKAHEIENLGWSALPMAALVISVFLFFLPTPLRFNLPAEIRPSFATSAQIAKQALYDAPLLGSGPGTFGFDYAKYKPVDVNKTPLWNTVFERSSSRFLTLLATTGLFGIISWLFLIILTASLAIFGLVKEKAGSLFPTQLGLSAAWFLLLFAKVFYSSNLTLELLFWLFTALIIAMTSHKYWEISLSRSPRASLAISFILTLSVIFTLSAFFLVGQRYHGDSIFKRAVLASEKGEDLEKVISYFDQAAGKNRWNDFYFQNLAQVLLARINQELSLAPTGDGAKKIQNLIAVDIDVAKKAVSLSPRNPANMATLATIYESVTPLVGGAGEWAITSWQSAIDMEPANPLYYTELGKSYVNAADLEAVKAQNSDEPTKKSAQTKVKENLTKAEENFDKAIELKKDYAPAHFQLAMVFTRQGKIKEAISKLQAMKYSLPNDVGISFQLGLLYYQNKELDRAVNELKTTLKLAPKFANARWYLAAIYEEQKKKDLALVELKEILKNDPENETVKNKITSLESQPASPATPLPAPLPEKK